MIGDEVLVPCGIGNLQVHLPLRDLAFVIRAPRVKATFPTTSSLMNQPGAGPSVSRKIFRRVSSGR